MEPLITTDPAITGGQPCIAGTRVPVAVITALLREGQTEAQLLADYPYLTGEQIQAAKDYEWYAQIERDAASVRVKALLKTWVAREMEQRAKNPMKNALGEGCATLESEATKACRVELFQALQPEPQI